MPIPEFTGDDCKNIIHEFRENRGTIYDNYKPPSQSSTVKPTSVSGNLHAESKN